MQMEIRNLAKIIGRGLLAPGLAMMIMMQPAASATELPETPEALMNDIRTAIETKNYDLLKSIVFWKDAGKIKKRIIRFQLNRNLGRKIKSLTWEDFPEGGFDGIIATGKLAPNMEMTNRVRVVFDEPIIESTGKQPTAVFLVGKRKGAWRIGLVKRGTNLAGQMPNSTRCLPKPIPSRMLTRVAS